MLKAGKVCCKVIFLPFLRILDKMPALKTCAWMAMPPTALISLASLLTYLTFRLVFLVTAEQVERRHAEEATLNQLRTLALPWIFFGLELIILCESYGVGNEVKGYLLMLLAFYPQCQMPFHTFFGSLLSSRRSERNGTWLAMTYRTSTSSSQLAMRTQE